MTNSIRNLSMTEEKISAETGSEPAETKTVRKEASDVGKVFSVWKVVLPVLIGISAVVLIFLRDAEKENLSVVFASIRFDRKTVGCLLLALCFMFGRDYGLSWRFRALTDRQLGWGKAFKVDMLCEFTSCVTPSAVGGSSLGMVFLNTQGIELGRATTLMMTTLFLDELFFVLACPLVVLFTPGSDIFSSGASGFSHGIRLTFWLVYVVLFVWTLILFLGLIVRPYWIKKILNGLFSLKLLRKWQPRISGLCDNMVATSVSLRSKPLRFWLEVFGGTALSWFSRYLVVNALFLGFVAGSVGDQWIILARQFVLWVVLMVSPTPGGSGLSEWLFSEYYGDLVTTAGMTLVLAIFWRIISYYIYLLIGSVIVPVWLRDSFGKSQKLFGHKTE